MIFLLLDLILSYFSSIPTFLFLLNILWIDKKRISKCILICLILDLWILNTYFLNTIIISILFILYKRLIITKVNIKTYLFSITFLYVTYIYTIGLLNGYHLSVISIFILKNYFANLIMYLLCYKIGKSHIKLCR